MPKSWILVSSDHNNFTQFSSESLANFRRACACAFLNRGTLQALQDFSPSWRSVLPIVFLVTMVPAALKSLTRSSRVVGCGGGTGLLISNNWKYSTQSPLCNYNPFESYCDYCNSSYKTPDCGNLPSPWPNSSHLPRRAGGAAVLFHGGWHSTLSLWRFQH